VDRPSTVALRYPRNGLRAKRYKLHQEYFSYKDKLLEISSCFRGLPILK
jgi:hypothetical protein